MGTVHDIKFHNTMTEQGNKLNELLGGGGNKIWLQSVTQTGKRALYVVKHSGPQLIYPNQPYRCPTGIKARHSKLQCTPTNPTMSPRLVLTDNPQWMGVKSYQNPGDGDREGFWNVT
jgi:hypothetical protein